MATISNIIIIPKWKILLLISFWTLSANLINQVASQSHNCSHVKCPPMSQITCPEDSYIREIKEESNLLSTSDNYERIEEIFVHCCVTQKCSCRVCHIPSCHNTSLVLMETIPETETPGKCCGQYECIYEPNCTEIKDTNGLHWLTDCQRCECKSGEHICHRSCDETLMPPQNCISPHLNRFFKNGDQWKEDPCTICECHNGKNNCQINLCRQLYCKKTIKIPGECCPVCVEENNDNIADVIILTTSPAPPTIETTINSTLFKIDNNVEQETTENIADIIIQESSSTTVNLSTTKTSTPSTTESTSTTTTSTTTTTTTTTIKPEIISTTTNDNENYNQIDEIHILVTEPPSPPLIKKPIESTTTHRTTKEPPVTYSVENSDTVHVIQPTTEQQLCYFYAIIAILSILLIIFIVLYCHERSKKRSYDPVPSTDDNFNKITPKIKNIECP